MKAEYSNSMNFANKELFQAVQGNITPSIRFVRTELFKAVKVTILRYSVLYQESYQSRLEECYSVAPREHNIAATLSLSFGPEEL